MRGILFALLATTALASPICFIPGPCVKIPLNPPWCPDPAYPDRCIDFLKRDALPEAAPVPEALPIQLLPGGSIKVKLKEPYCIHPFPDQPEVEICFDHLKRDSDAEKLAKRNADPEPLCFIPGPCIKIPMSPPWCPDPVNHPDVCFDYIKRDEYPVERDALPVLDA